MKVNRAGIEFELTKDEVYAAHWEWEYGLAYEVIYGRLEHMYDGWPCSLSGPSLDEIVEEAVSSFLDSMKYDCTREWSYDNAIAEVIERYGHENTISSEGNV